MVETIPKKIHQILFLICIVYTLWYTCHMNEEIINRTLQVFLYTGGIVAFWQITKHMPKVFHNLLEYTTLLSFAVACVMPIACLIEYILVGNIHNTMAFVGCVCGVSFLSVVWMTLVGLSRSMQGKEQFKYVVL